MKRRVAIRFRARGADRNMAALIGLAQAEDFPAEDRGGGAW